jgi:hypothetical protein
MPTKINNDSMSLEIDGHVIASAECRDTAAEIWTVSSYLGRLFTLNQAALVAQEATPAGVHRADPDARPGQPFPLLEGDGDRAGLGLVDGKEVTVIGDEVTVGRLHRVGPDLTAA